MQSLIIQGFYHKAITFFSNSTSFSNMIGNKKCNRYYFEKKYPQYRFSFRMKDTLPEDTYIAEPADF